jgi:hypothetical protein
MIAGVVVYVFGGRPGDPAEHRDHQQGGGQAIP